MPKKRSVVKPGKYAREANPFLLEIFDTRSRVGRMISLKTGRHWNLTLPAHSAIIRAILTEGTFLEGSDSRFKINEVDKIDGWEDEFE